MKKQFFSFVMMLALVIVAGSAMAQTSTTTYEGGTYSYTLSGITVVSASTATVTYEGGGSGATLPTPISIATTDHSITFNVTYALGATDGNLKVNIVDATSCSNYITLAIDVKAAPTLVLGVDVPDFTCQNLGTPVNNESAADATGTPPAANVITFTVTPTISVASGYTYDFDLDLTQLTSGLTGFTVAHATGNGTITGDYANGFSVVGSTSASHTFTITFTTTTGKAAETYTGTISGAKLHIAAISGNYDGTYSPNNDVVTVKSIPKIGTFTGL